MTSTEIREQVVGRMSDGSPDPNGFRKFELSMLQEIAAQLAKLNENLEWVIDGGYVRVETR
jgi:hypothetical protein